MAKTFKINNASDRAALESALWYCASDVPADDTLSSDLFYCFNDVALADDNAAAATMAEADRKLGAWRGFDARSRRSGKPRSGAQSSSPPEEDRLIYALDACKDAIERYEEFSEQPADRRRRMLATRDAANRFLAKLGEQRLAADAVAS